MKYLLIVRHGESVFNALNKFCGWIDAELSPHGKEEAQRCGKILAERMGTKPGYIYTSRLQRSQQTQKLASEVAGWSDVPVEPRWEMNERMYGDLQDKNKTEVAEKFGADQLKIWRRSYSTPPPPMDRSNPAHPCHSPLYADLDPAVIPDAESLELCSLRVMKFYNTVVLEKFKEVSTIAMFAHGNSLRALVQKLEGLTNEAVIELNIPTACPYLITFDDDMKFQEAKYLMDEAEVKALVEAVANQGKK